MSKITVELNKITVSEFYNQVIMCNDLGFPSYGKGEPINKLMREIKKEVKKQRKQDELGWKDFWNFWPLSIVTPIMLLSIILAPFFQ